MFVHGIGQHTPSFWTLMQLAYYLTIMTSFDMPCNLWPVVASLVLAGICLILHQKSKFVFDVSCFLTDTFVENDSGSSLNLHLRSFISADSVLVNLLRYDWTFWCVTAPFVFGSESNVHLNQPICASNCIMVPALLICSHSTHSTSLAFTVHTFLP
jgi:hypothetical protein